MTESIYFIRPVGQVGPIKIGYSHMPSDRLCAMMNWSPLPLEIVATLPGNFQDEQAYHALLADHHLHHEWFEPAPLVLEVLAFAERGLPYPFPTNLDISRRPREYSRGARKSLQLRYARALRNVGSVPPLLAEESSQRVAGMFLRMRVESRQPTENEAAFIEGVIGALSGAAVEPSPGHVMASFPTAESCQQAAAYTPVAAVGPCMDSTSSVVNGAKA